MSLDGAGAEAVLARICPLDLRENQFRRGQTARTDIAHMMALLCRTTKGFEIWVMRSFAQSAVDHISRAMRSVAASDGPV